MNKKLTSSHNLLNEKGQLIETGYSTDLLFSYNRKDIKAHPLRIKEWDYYLICTKNLGVALTIADNSYMGLASISLLDFKEPWQHTKTFTQLLPLGSLKMPASSSKGDVSISKKNYHLAFTHCGSHRELIFQVKNFKRGVSIDGSFHLENPKQDSIVMVTPFHESKKAFYYNQKINCLPAWGTVTYDGTSYHFDKGEAFGVLDWGRGVWPYKNSWYWASASGLHEGNPLGWNLGYGFGNTEAATENAIFYKGKAHKLNKVIFHIPMKNKRYTPHGSGCICGVKEGFDTMDMIEDYMAPWTFADDENRLSLDFFPIIDRSSLTDLKVLKSDQHQVFGRYTGTLVLDDGTVLKIKDFLGFAEKVSNKW